MAGNEVTLTFAGDSAKLEKAFANVGDASKKMTDKVGEASKKVGEHENALGKLGEKADGSERNLIGVHDVIDGTATIMQGPGKAGISAYVQGWADLAGGIAPLAETLKKTSVAQWLLNIAQNASPVVLITIAVIALVAIIVVIATKTTWFQDIWKAAWGGIKSAASAVWDWLKQVPGWIGDAFGKVADFISKPFKAAFNFVADAWNGTIGKLSWTVPGWVPLIGGNTISVPKLPHFAQGGIVPGMAGSEVLAVVHGGEEIKQRGTAGTGGSGVLRVVGNGDSALASFLHSLTQQGILQFVME